MSQIPNKSNYPRFYFKLSAGHPRASTELSLGVKMMISDAVGPVQANPPCSAQIKIRGAKIIRDYRGQTPSEYHES